MHWCEGGLGDFGGFGWFLVVFGDFCLKKLKIG
jgi:hypothetical protein